MADDFGTVGPATAGCRDRDSTATGAFGRMVTGVFERAATRPHPRLTTEPVRRVPGGTLGALIVAASAVAFSTAGLFTRLIDADVWTMLFWRGLSGGLLIMACIAWQHRAGTATAFAAIGRAGLVVAACSTVATICFISALRATTVADVTILYATAPFIAAALAWIWLRETPPVATLLASLLGLIGVAVMGSGALSGGHLMATSLPWS